MIKVGFGYDIHRLKKGRKFLLGGVEIPFPMGEDGHSDGDVLVHAICDALLGASALGDIGEMFPPSDPAYKDAASIKLLHIVCKRVKEAGWKINNIDCVIICEKPKVLPYRDDIRRSLADVLEVGIENIFLKGKTAEGLGSTGKGKAVEAYAVCLLERN